MSTIAPANQIPAFNRFPHNLGIIVATTTAKDNSDTAAPFTIPAGSIVMLIPDAACYVSSEFPSASISATNSTPLGANEKATFILWSTETKVAVKSASGTVNCRVLVLG